MRNSEKISVLCNSLTLRNYIQELINRRTPARDKVKSLQSLMRKIDSVIIDECVELDESDDLKLFDESDNYYFDMVISDAVDNSKEVAINASLKENDLVLPNALKKVEPKKEEAKTVEPEYKVIEVASKFPLESTVSKIKKETAKTVASIQAEIDSIPDESITQFGNLVVVNHSVVPEGTLLTSRKASKSTSDSVVKNAEKEMIPFVPGYKSSAVVLPESPGIVLSEVKVVPLDDGSSVNDVAGDVEGKVIVPFPKPKPEKKKAFRKVDPSEYNK